MSTIPRIEGATSDEWTDWHWYTTVVHTNCREIIDNVVDMAHFFYIHGSLPTQFKNIFEGHVATQYMNSAGRPDIGEPGESQMLGTTSVASYYGPSFMIDDLIYHYTRHRSPHDPHQLSLSDRREFLCAAIRNHRQEVGVPARGRWRCRPRSALGDFVKMGFEQDVAIWRNKARIDNPLLVEEDGPVYQLRRWYEQFYVDAADVTPDMVDRFEFEIDTSQTP